MVVVALRLSPWSCSCFGKSVPAEGIYSIAEETRTSRHARGCSERKRQRKSAVVAAEWTVFYFVVDASNKQQIGALDSPFAVVRFARRARAPAFVICATVHDRRLPGNDFDIDDDCLPPQDGYHDIA